MQPIKDSAKWQVEMPLVSARSTRGGNNNGNESNRENNNRS
jgi:hypothetical protein